MQQIDLVPTEEWEQRAEELKNLVKVGDGESLRLHLGIGPGMFEIALSLAQVFSHRRALGWVKGNSPAFDHVAPWFLKEAYAVQSTTWSELSHPEQITAWVQGLKKETSFVLFSEDHPITGALANFDELDRQLNERKIFVLRVSHRAHLFQSPTIRPYSLRLSSFGDRCALSHSGQRIRLSPAFADRVRWTGEHIAELAENLKHPPQENKMAVENFEASFPRARLFSPNQSRIYDRATIAFDDVSSESLAYQLCREKGVSVNDVGTANLCEWSSSRLLKGWWENSPSENQLRGLMVFSSEACGRKDFAKVVRETYEDLQKQQVW